MRKVYKKREYRRWTDTEVEELREGKVPAGRSYSHCCMKAWQLGIPSPESPTGRRSWTQEDIDTLVKEHRVPPGRTVTACITRGYGLGLRVFDLGDGNLSVEPMSMEPPSRRELVDKAELLSRMRDAGLTFVDMSERLGVSKQYLCEMVHRYRKTEKYEKSRKRAEDKVDKLVQQFNEMRG